MGATTDPENHLIANEVASRFPDKAVRLREVLRNLISLPGSPEPPTELTKLQAALDACLKNIRQTKPTVLSVKRNLDALRDGIQMLNRFEAELDEAAVQSVRTLADVQRYQLNQLRELGDSSGEIDLAGERIDQQLSSDRPWREIASLDADVTTLKDAYRESRRGLLGWQETEAEEARGRVKLRPDFSKLTAEVKVTGPSSERFRLVCITEKSKTKTMLMRS